jgi:hypothetical protein
MLLAVLVLLMSSAPPLPSGATFTHTVRKGESISLICIDYYGYYSDQLGRAVQGENPSIKSIDVIYPGQEILLHRPVELKKSVTSGKTVVAAHEPDVTGEAQEDRQDTLFTRKISVTQGVVTYMEGVVNFRRKTGSKKQPLKINMVVTPGNIIETGSDGRVEIIINREAVVRLRENTRTVLEAFRKPAAESKKTRIGCSIGGLWTKVKKFKDKISRFELELPTAIAGVHGTVYESTVASDSSSEVKVFSGEVAVSGSKAQEGEKNAASGSLSEVPGPHEVAPPHEVTMEDWTRIVRSMQKITVDNKGRPSAPESFTRDTKSSWEEWNRIRDRRIAALFEEL